MTSAPRSTRDVVIAAGPSIEHSMIRNPCSGGVVAIAPPVREGRIVAVTDPGAGAPGSSYWGDGVVTPRRRLDGVRGHGAQLRIARAGQPRSHGRRSARPPGARATPLAPGSSTTGGASSRPNRRRTGRCPRRNGRRRWAKRRGSPTGWPSSSARWPTGRRSPSSASGCPGCCRGRSAPPPTASSARPTPCARWLRSTRRPVVSSWPSVWRSGPRTIRSCRGHPS